MTDTVHILEFSEQGMGGHILGVFATAELARAELRLRIEASGEAYRNVGPDRWDDHGDMLTITEHAVAGEREEPVRFMRNFLADHRAQLHSVRVGLRFPAGSVGRTAGYLHDVVEDSEVTVADIRAKFGDDVADAVDAVTRREGEVYADFIARAGQHPVGRAVKLADLRDNLSDLPEGTLRERYRRAVLALLDPKI